MKKAVCLTLSAGMLAGNPAVSVLAEETAQAEAFTSSVPLKCETESINLVDNGRSVVLHLRVNQEDARIQKKIYGEDIVLGGAFQDMTVSNVRNDEKTILVDLIGVPVLSGEKQGTMEFPGFLFGEEDNAYASVDVVAKESTEEDVKPAFYPYFDGMRIGEKTAELSIELTPQLGSFAEDFGEEDVQLALDLNGASIESFEKSGNDTIELLVSVPKEAMDADAEDFSCYGGIILSENSMVTPGGKVYGRKLYAEREYSTETIGRDLTGEDVQTIKNIVGGFGNTTFGTLSGLVSAGSSVGNAAYTALSVLGVFPSDASRHAEIMGALREIQGSIDEVNEKCDYMNFVLKEHLRKLDDLGVKADEQYLGGFNSSLTSMVDDMDRIEDALQDPEIRSEIEAAIERVAAKYLDPEYVVGRDFDGDFGDFTSEPGYDQADYDLTVDGIWEDPVENAYVDAVVEDQAFSDGSADVAMADTAGEMTGETDLFSSADVGEAEFVSEVVTEETQDPSVTEGIVLGDRKLSADETIKFLSDLDTEIGQIHVTANITIGMLLVNLDTKYTNLIGRFDVNDSSNPIIAYGNAHTGTDNFATTSLKEKELYKQNVIYQFTRAATMLTALDSPTKYQYRLEDLKKRTEDNLWPDVEKGVRDADGNPFCYLMEGYVRLATVNEVQGFWMKLKYPPFKSVGYQTKVTVKNKSGKDVDPIAFQNRMQGRTLLQDLELAGVKNLYQVKDHELFETHNGPVQISSYYLWEVEGPQNSALPYGITFGYERWGINSGEVRVGNSTNIRGYGTVDSYNRSSDYWLVSPYCLCWDERSIGEPASARWFDSYKSQEWYEMPMTFLVLV